MSIATTFSFRVSTIPVDELNAIMLRHGVLHSLSVSAIGTDYLLLVYKSCYCDSWFCYPLPSTSCLRWLQCYLPYSLLLQQIPSQWTGIYFALIILFLLKTKLEACCAPPVGKAQGDKLTSSVRLVSGSLSFGETKCCTCVIAGGRGHTVSAEPGSRTPCLYSTVTFIIVLLWIDAVVVYFCMCFVETCWRSQSAVSCLMPCVDA